jgi:hypothetical protein
VSPEGITTDLENQTAVRECPSPKNKQKIRSFLGLCTYYRRLISGFANIVKLPTKLTEKMQAFQWTPEVQAAFHTLNEASVLPLFVLTSSQVIGSSLTQVRVIAYYSNTLNKAEKLLRHPAGTTCNREDIRTSPYVPLRARPAHRPLCINLAHEFQDPGRTP